MKRKSREVLEVESGGKVVHSGGKDQLGITSMQTTEAGKKRG